MLICKVHLFVSSLQSPARVVVWAAESDSQEFLLLLSLSLHVNFVEKVTDP